MAKENDLLNQSVRGSLISEMFTQENLERKREARRRTDIRKGSMMEWLHRELRLEYDIDTVDRMRKVSSINFVDRIVREKASIYKDAPERHWTNTSNDAQNEQLDEYYREGKYNVWLKAANAGEELQDQCTIQVLPMNGKLVTRVLTPQYYDVIPREDDPTRALAYIVNLKEETTIFRRNVKESTKRRTSRDTLDQEIGDWDDNRVDRESMRLEWWTDNYNFVTDGNGRLIDEVIDNHVKTLPFIDVAMPLDKEFRFWVFSDSKLIRFQLDIAKKLSDLAEAIKMQGYAYGVLSATEKPESFQAGPAKWLYLKQDPDNPENKPEFDFKSPNADLSGMIESINQDFAMFLSSEGIDPSTVSGSMTGHKSFSSGVERFLAMLEKFEASQEKVDLFKWVEDQLVTLVVLWNNAAIGNPEVIESAKVLLPEDTGVEVVYVKPEAAQTKKEQEESTAFLLKEGLLTKKDAVMRIHGFDEERASEYLTEITEESAPTLRIDLGNAKENTDEE